MTTELALAQRKRRSFSKAFKAQVVAQCVAGVPTAAVALSHGLNTNMVWKWVRKAETADALSAPAAFIPVPSAVSPMARSQPIEVELRRGDVHVEVRWPVGDAPSCAAWLRDLLR